jgi:hypothetical protein
MRDLIDSLLQIGLKVEFSVDVSGSPTIKVQPISASPDEKPLLSCILTPGTFRESSEEVLASFLKSIQKKH